jgi:SAM-dependent methyltransferase
MDLKCLNLGCGDRFHPEWTNVDIVPCHPSIIAHDIRHSLPFADSSFDVVYHSHVLEHLKRDVAPSFLRSCHRVLRPSGLIRVVVPDLEEIARQYLQALERALGGDAVADVDHQWMVLELYDQTVREHSGGGFADLVSRSRLRNADFVRRRWGAQGEQLIEMVTAPEPAPPPSLAPHRSRAGWWWRRGVELLTSKSARREFLLRRLLAQEYRLVRDARFREGGEIHQWMYDRHSLARLLREAGFAEPVCRHPDESAILDWKRFNLDTEPDGRVYKPDSLFMEARRSPGSC